MPLNSDALLVGAVGGPKWDHIVVEGEPEEQDGLMKLRHELEVFASLRWARAYDPLLSRTPFRPEVARSAAGVAVVILGVLISQIPPGAKNPQTQS